MNETLYFLVKDIDRFLPYSQASLFKGIVLGVNLNKYSELYLNIKKVGLLHLVVFSGANITIITSIVSNLLSSFSKKISILINLIIIIFFVYLLGFQAPIIRSAFMSILTLVAILYNREIYSLYGLALAYIFIAIFFPDILFSISNQLSFGATLAIILFGKSSFSSSNLLIDYSLKELKPSIMAFLFTLPIMVINFHEVSFISPIANILVAFVVVPIMFIGLIAVITSKISILLASPLFFILYGLLTYMIWVIDFLSKFKIFYFTFK